MLYFIQPAAFRRLCVETRFRLRGIAPLFPAAFRRLCVETAEDMARPMIGRQPPSGGCVLKRRTKTDKQDARLTSRLQAAVC